MKTILDYINIIFLPVLTFIVGAMALTGTGVACLITLLIAIVILIAKEFFVDEKYSSILNVVFFTLIIVSNILLFATSVIIDSKALTVLSLVLLIDWVACVIDCIFQSADPLTKEENDSISETKTVLKEMKRKNSKNTSIIKNNTNKDEYNMKKAVALLFNIGAIICCVLLSIVIVLLICTFIDISNKVPMETLSQIPAFKAFLVITSLIIISFIVNLYCIHFNRLVYKKEYIIFTMIYNFAMSYLTIVLSIIFAFFAKELSVYIAIMYFSIAPLTIAAILYLSGIIVQSWNKNK